MSPVIGTGPDVDTGAAVVVGSVRTAPDAGAPSDGTIGAALDSLAGATWVASPGLGGVVGAGLPDTEDADSVDADSDADVDDSFDDVQAAVVSKSAPPR